MRLFLKHPDGVVNEFQFKDGPITIGRHVTNNIFIPNRAVSRQHAVIFKSEENKWMVEDLKSSNKTYLNTDPVYQAEIKDGDKLRIASYEIEIKMNDLKSEEQSIDMQDTLINEKVPDGQVIIRRTRSKHCPSIRLPGKRIKDYVEATEEICHSHGPEAILNALLHLGFRQFGCYRVWCGIRSQISGPMPHQHGKIIDGRGVDFEEIEFKEKINEALKKNYFILVPKVEERNYERNYQSLMAAPILSEKGCFGVIYMDNLGNHPKFTACDLDYLMFLAIHTAVVIENF